MAHYLNLVSIGTWGALSDYVHPNGDSDANNILWTLLWTNNNAFQQGEVR